MSKAEGASQPPGDVFNIDRIRDLINLMKEHELSEVDLKQGDQQIRLARGSSVPMGVAPPPVMPYVAAAPVAAPAAPAAPAADVDGPHIKLITSPMVGTFYCKPNPTSPDFVKVGSKVSPDTVVCTVEAMKVFNEIPAEISGTIVAVLVGNEEPVDFGRPLFKVDTRG